MPTATSSPEPATQRSRAREATRAARDVGHLLWFRTRTLPAALLRAALALGAVSLLAAALVPALLPGAGDPRGAAPDLLEILPGLLLGFLVVVAVTSAAAGGGYQLLPPGAAAIHPLSPTTDHLGALLVAPLNLAWVLQAWILLALSAYATGGSGRLVVTQVVVALWIAVATAAAQVMAWGVEALRRGPRGALAVGVLAALGVATVVALHLAALLVPLLARPPTRWLVLGATGSPGGAPWPLVVAVEVVALLALVVLGAVPAHRAASRLPAAETRRDASVQRPRREPRTATGALLRLDRASVWRAVPLRRGVLVLSAGPGLVALVGGVPWASMSVLPSLVASGGALLFGVNVWCLDAGGALWRESLPVDPGTVFWVRAWVLVEFLAVAPLVCVAVAVSRAGRPTPGEVSALVCSLVVVLALVVTACLGWSQRRPSSVDLRSARATPVAPLLMLGYSARLAAGTTVVGVVFSVLAVLPGWQAPVLLAVPVLGVAVLRLLRQRRAWLDPARRSVVVAAVAG